MPMSSAQSNAHSQHDRMLSPAGSAPPRESGARWDPVAVLLAAALLVLLLALAAAVIWWYGTVRIMPGVQAMGIALEGMSAQEAVAALDQAWQRETVVLQYDRGALSAPAAELGLALDAETMVRSAFVRGRAWPRLRKVVGGLEPVYVRPVVWVDREIARRYLEGVASRVAVPPVDAGLRLVGAEVEVIPAAVGLALDVPGTLDALSGAPLAVVESGRIDLHTVPVAPVRADVGPLVEQAEARIGTPLAIRARDPIRDESLWWTPPVEAWGTWWALEIDPIDPGGLLWEVDRAAVRQYVAAQAALLEPERYIEIETAVNVVIQAMEEAREGVFFRIYHRPGRHIVQAGETLASIARNHGFPYPWLEQANPGVEALRPGQVVAIPSPDVLLPLPIAWHKRIVISIGRQRMWAYEWEALKWEWAVSTGIASSPTSPGVFQVQQHERNAYAASWDLWMPYFIGIYRPVPAANFMNGFHGFPTRDGATLLWTGDLGHPVTYGCILVSTSHAAHLYDWAEPGVIVEIRP